MKNMTMPQGSMPCPICTDPLNIRFDQINRNVQCTACKFEFEAAPYKAPVEVIRLSGACSFTKRPFVIALTRDAKSMRGGVVERNDLYRVVHTYEQRNSGVGQVQRIGAIPISEITNFSFFNCPFCLKHGFDFCSCGTWLCKSAGYWQNTWAPPIVAQYHNYCPGCGFDGVFDTPVTEVEIFGHGPQGNQSAARRGGMRLGLPAPTSIIRRRSS